MLGRLETTTVKFDIGKGGGKPELTAQDIAAALGLCADKFAATIYIAVFGGTIDLASIDQHIAQCMFGEWRRRADAFVDAQLKIATAEFAAAEARAGRLKAAVRDLEIATAGMWPSLHDDSYPRMRLALLHELRSARICPVCNGRRHVLVWNQENNRTDIKGCENCLESGRIAISDRRRADLLGMNESTYRRGKWPMVYEWMYRTLNDAIYKGRKEFKRALGRASQ
jgi:hypothetical protein